MTTLVKTTGHTEVIKVKSMATQEIGLVKALENAGITAHETDLAEMIIQLSHDRPSHIVVPALHRNRAEIRQIFREHMPDAPKDLTDDPQDLAEAARLHLRRLFLKTPVAVSGANFAIAETGGLLVAESEGNGRMCLTLPRDADQRRRDREADPQVQRPRGVPAAAPALGDGRAHEPVQLDLDGGHAKRRTADRSTSSSSTTDGRKPSPTTQDARR